MSGEARPPWESDLDHGHDRLRASLRAAHPLVAADEIEALGSGWDNTAVLVDGRWVFRFARRELAAELLRHEWTALRAIGGELPLEVPRPRWFAAQLDAPEFPQLGYECLPGRTACGVDWDARDQVEAARSVGAFLGALHRWPLDQDARRVMPGDTIRRADTAYRLERMRAPAERASVARPALAASIERAMAVAAELANAAPAAELSLVHGDLYARHVLVDDACSPCGVIDWGDVHLGDAAIDLNFGYAWAPEGPARDAFFGAYGAPVDDATHVRARFRAIHYGVLLTWYGAEAGDAAIERAGGRALAFAT